MTVKFSKIIITPSNWETGTKADLLSKNWVLSYYYYCDDSPKGKQIRIKGMNRAKTLDEKRFITKQLIKNEEKLLKNGYNPITKTMEVAENTVTPKTPFIKALQLALSELHVLEASKKDMTYILKHVEQGAIASGLKLTPIVEIQKKEIKIILNWLSKNGRSNYRVNKVRSVLSSLFSYLVEIDIFDINFIHGISKLQHASVERKVIRDDQQRNQFAKLKDTNYPLWRFATIFYYSGCRIEEILRTKVYNVDIERQCFRIEQKKGGKIVQLIKPINYQVAYLWQELLQDAKPDEHIFGKKLSPDLIPSTRDAIGQKWKLWAKTKLNIDCDLYALKHTFLNDLTKAYGISTAKDIAGHTNEKTTMIYAVDYKESLVDKQKMVNVKL